MTPPRDPTTIFTVERLGKRSKHPAEKAQHQAHTEAARKKQHCRPRSQAWTSEKRNNVRAMHEREKAQKGAGSMTFCGEPSVVAVAAAVAAAMAMAKEEINVTSE